jgi:hypothetical protein
LDGLAKNTTQATGFYIETTTTPEPAVYTEGSTSSSTAERELPAPWSSVAMHAATETPGSVGATQAPGLSTAQELQYTYEQIGSNSTFSLDPPALTAPEILASVLVNLIFNTSAIDSREASGDNIETSSLSQISHYSWVSAFDTEMLASQALTHPLTTQPRTLPPYLLSRRPAMGMPDKAVSIHLEIANAAWILYDELVLSTLNLDSKQKVPCNLNLLSRSSDNGTLLVSATLLGPEGLHGIVLIDLGISGERIPIISFNFTFFSIAKIKIIDVSLNSSLVFGGSYISLTILNLPETTKCEDILFEFTSNNKAKCVSLNFQYDADPLKSNLTMIIPRVAHSGTIVPSLKLLIENQSFSVSVEFGFAYWDPPLPYVSSVMPSIASISKSNEIAISIQNFPPVKSLNEIIAEFTWLDSSKRTFAIVRGFISIPNSVLYVNISSPEKKEANSGASVLTINHEFYPYYKAQLVGFLFVDNSNPQITRLQLIGSPPAADILRVPMSKPQIISISIQDVPANFDGTG